MKKRKRKKGVGGRRGEGGGVIRGSVLKGVLSFPGTVLGSAGSEWKKFFPPGDFTPEAGETGTHMPLASLPRSLLACMGEIQLYPLIPVSSNTNQLHTPLSCR